MADHSAIEWTDATWNPTTGCTKISPGCAHCYIERTPAFRIAGNKFEHGKTDLTIFHDRLEQPLHWRKPRRIFVNSLSDLFHEGIGDAFIDRVFAVMALTPQHTFQVLTKRAERMRDHIQAFCSPDGYDRRVAAIALMHPWPPSSDSMRITRFLGGNALPNVWLGVSVENQHFADERIPLLLQTPAAVRFISAEPLLGPVDISMWLYRGVIEAKPGDADYDALQWVIVGGESGPQSRPFDVAWARSIVRQCQGAGVPVFVKQLGARAYGPDVHSAILRDKKGGDPDEWPADLRVREYPASTWNSPPRGGVAET